MVVDLNAPLDGKGGSYPPLPPWSGENPACSVPALQRCEVNGHMTMACKIMSIPPPTFPSYFISSIDTFERRSEMLSSFSLVTEDKITGGRGESSISKYSSHKY